MKQNGRSLRFALWYNMKKIILLTIGLVAFLIWANINKNLLAVWFNSDSFYKPIYSSSFDVSQPGTVVRAELTPAYEVEHGFHLSFPCESIPLDNFANLDGSIRYTIESKGIKLVSRTIQIPSHPISILEKNGCEIVLFTFELPYKGHEIVTLEVNIEEPILKLATYQNIRCEVAPAYWPK